MLRLRQEVVFMVWAEAAQWGFSRARKLQIKTVQVGWSVARCRCEVFSLQACRVGVPEQSPQGFLHS